MNEDKKIGDISVNMGNGNSVGHIGHKITVQSPPPDPNTIWQNGKAVGTIGGNPALGNGIVFFEKVFTDGSLDIDQEFFVRGLRLKIKNDPNETMISQNGRPPQHTFWQVICRIVG